jgi:signal transduction histidine kinase
MRIYLFFSVIIFAASVPVFYYLVQDLWIQDVDESLIFQKEKIISGIGSSNFDSTTISNFTNIASKLDLGITIDPLPFSQQERDSVYYNSFYDNTRTHVEPFRELKSIVKIDNQFYRILIRKDLVENADLIQSIVIAEALLFLLLLTGILLLNSYFSKKTWRPFYHLINQLKSFKIDKGQVFITEKSDIDEFEELNRSVLQLTENNIKVFNSQKEFTENAAHETQTPLSVIKNQIDLLAQNENLSLEQADIIERIDKNIRYMTKLNRNLLLLSKIENVQFDRSEVVDIHSIVKEVIDTFYEQIELKGIKLTVGLSSQPNLQSNSHLVHSLISNLLKNAIKYNIPNGFIDISLNGNSFLILNSGVSHSLPSD